MYTSGRILIWFGMYILLSNKHLVMLQKHGPVAIRINKCCEKNEILIDLRCTKVNQTSGEFCEIEFKDEKIIIKGSHTLCYALEVCLMRINK